MQSVLGWEERSWVLEVSLDLPNYRKVSLGAVLAAGEGRLGERLSLRVFNMNNQMCCTTGLACSHDWDFPGRDQLASWLGVFKVSTEASGVDFLADVRRFLGVR